ncbi:hypothetical protein PP713_14205 [Mycobacterium sp. CSUR Q5927]|nr:hypothetical protein [Mycobacterium sp. CSUR Q5927]
MSIAERLAELEGRDTCGSCRFYKALPKAEKAAFDAWVEQGLSIRQLHDECVKVGLTVARSTFGDHIRLCHKKQA